MFGFKKKRGNGQVRFDRVKAIGGGCYLADTHTRFWSAIPVVFLSALLLFAGAFSMFRKESSPKAAGASSNAVNIGSLLVSDYATRQANGDAGVFDAQAMNHLYELLTGIKDATFDDLKTYVNNTPSSQHGDVIGRTSNDFRTSVSHVLGSARDIEFDFGGKTWTPGYLFKNSKDGNIYLDILMDTSLGQAEWGYSTWVCNNTDAGAAINNGAGNFGYANPTPGNMYGVSPLRAQMLNNGGSYATQGYCNYSSASATLTSPLPVATQNASSPLAVFTMPSVSGSLTNYIAKPSQIYYQEIGATSMDIIRPSECYGNPWSADPSHPSYTASLSSAWEPYYDYRNKPLYTQWTGDYLWLPSYREANGVWQLSNNQRMPNGIKMWTRSGTTKYPKNNNGIVIAMTPQNTQFNTQAMVLSTQGDNENVNYDTAGVNFDVRPALHLNLTAANNALVYSAPTYASNMEPTYNGVAQNHLTDGVTKKLSDATLSGSTYVKAAYSPSWYDPNFFNVKAAGNTTTRTGKPVSGVTLKYYKGLSADGKGLKGGTSCEVSSMIDAGDYEVAVTLPSGSGWSSAADATKGETTQTRVFKFKIKQKEIGLTLTSDNTGEPTVALASGSSIYARDGSLSASDFVYEYAWVSGGDAQSQNWYDTHDKDTKPGRFGTYSVKLTGFAEGKTAGSGYTGINDDGIAYNNNYKLNPATYTVNFTVGKTSVSAPTVSGNASVNYDGSSHDFSVTYDSEKVTLTLPSNASGKLTLENDGSGKPTILRGTAAGKYEITASLTDNGDNTEWSDASTNTDAVRKITVEIVPISINFTASKSLNEGQTSIWNWTLGDTGDLTVTATGPNSSTAMILAGDTVTYEFGYTSDATDPTKFVLLGEMEIKTEASSGKKYPTYKTDISAFTTAGTFTLVVREKSGSENGNYKIVSGFTSQVTISAKALNMDDLLFEIEQDGTKYQVKVTIQSDGTYVLAQNGALPAGAKIGNNILELTYSTKAYDFSALVSGSDVSIDTGKAGTNGGYTGSRHATGCVKKSDGTYDTVTLRVYLKTSTGAEFAPGVTERSFELVYRLNPQELDLSKLEWNYKATDATGASSWPEYDGTSKTVTLSGVPAGLTATYGNATKTEPGKYTATVTFSYDTTNYTVKNDDNASDKDTDKTNLAYWKSYDWEIVKILIDTSVWEDPDKDSGDSSSPIYWAPTLGVPAGGKDYSPQIYYKYYDDEDKARGDEDGSEGSDDFEIDETTTVVYYVRVFVKAEYGDYYEIDKEHYYVYSFTVGSGKSAVKLKFETTSVEYDGNGHFENKDLDFIGLSNLNKETDIRLTYYKYDGNAEGNKGEALGAGEKPTAVGKYVVELELTDPAAQDNVLATKRITVEITAIKLKTEDLKWTIEDESGNAIAEYDAEIGKWILVKPDADGNPQHTVLDKNSDADLYAEIFGYSSKGGLRLKLKGDVYTTQTDGTGKPIKAEKTESEDGLTWTFKREIGGVEEVLFTVELVGATDPSGNKNVGKHEIEVQITAGPAFTGDGAGNIELPEIGNAEWEVVKAKIDGSKLAWDYPEEGYSYELGEETNEAGQKLPRERIVRIVMKDENGNVIYEKDENGELKMDAEGRPIPVLPEGLTVTANGSGYKSSGVGLHSARYDLTIADSDNYEFGTFGSGLNVTKTSNGYYAMLSWEIGALKLEVPEAPSEDVVFNAQENPNLLELLFADNEFIWNNWSDYFSVSVTYTEPDHLFGDPETLVDENGNPILTAANAGNYTLTFTLLDENNVMWKDETVTPKQIALEVKPFEIKVTGWGSNHQPLFDGEVPSEYYERIATYVDPETGEEKPTTSTSGFDIKYRVRIKVKEEYAGNVTLSYGEGVDEVHEFTNKNQLPPNTTKVNIPTLTTKELTFNGSEQSIEVKGFTEVSKQVIEVYVTEGGEYADGVLRFKNAGEYTVTMKIKDGANAVWQSADETYNETKVTVTYTVSVSKARIEASWEQKSKKEAPKLSVPEGWDAEVFAGLIEYVYTDAEGKKLLPEELNTGAGYKVTAKLKGENVENAEFVVEENGEQVTCATVETEFEIKLSSNALNELFGLPDDFPLWQIIVITVCLILFIIFMILTAKKRKEKKEAEEEMKKYREDMEELSEE